MSRKLPKRGLPPMHPGELLREEVLPALDRSKTEIARLLGVSRQTLYDILAQKQPVTPGMALRLGKLCGNGPDLWLNLQKRYDFASGAARTRREDQENSDAGSRVKLLRENRYHRGKRLVWTELSEPTRNALTKAIIGR